MMRGIAIALAIAAACTLAVDVTAQTNDDEYTPLNSRIRRDRQFPTDIVNRWRNETSEVSRKRSREMMSQFSRCMYNRSHEGALSLLERTDFGFVEFEQIGLDNDRALRNFGFRDCLSRVANTHGTGVQLRFWAGALRQWLLQEAYLDRYKSEPTWVRAGDFVAERSLPLSGQNPQVKNALDFADCVVATDPYTADFFFRTSAGSSEERQAIGELTPSLGSCLPEGVQLELSPVQLRVWVGEALWHAANHSNAAPRESAPGQEAAQ